VEGNVWRRARKCHLPLVSLVSYRLWCALLGVLLEPRALEAMVGTRRQGKPSAVCLIFIFIFIFFFGSRFPLCFCSRGGGGVGGYAGEQEAAAVEKMGRYVASRVERMVEAEERGVLKAMRERVRQRVGEEENKL